METCEVVVTKHAHSQYCNRVEAIGHDELIRLCQQQIESRNYDYFRKGFVHLAGVWWVYEMQGSLMTMITCYGRTNMHMPKALKWADRHNDRIDLVRMI